MFAMARDKKMAGIQNPGILTSHRLRQGSQAGQVWDSKPEDSASTSRGILAGLVLMGL